MSTDGEGSSRAVGYLPGDRWLIAGDSAVIQLSGAASDAMRWWPAVRGGATASALIEQVHADGVLGAGQALSIVVVEGDAVRVLAQGDAAVVVETVAGEQVTVSGSGLLTWAEVVVPAAAVVHLDVPGALPEAGDLLPMPTGVVQVGPVRWQLAPAAAGAVAAAGSMPAEGMTPDPPRKPAGDDGSEAVEGSGTEDLDGRAPDDTGVRVDGDEPDDDVTVIAVVPSADHGAGGSGNAAAPDAALSHDTAAPHDTVPPPVEVPHAEVTQTVTEDELEELPDDERGDDQRADEAGTPVADGDLEASPETIAATLNPFPSMALPAFVPPPFTPPSWSPPAFASPPTDLRPVSAPPFVPASTSLPPIAAVPAAAAEQDAVPTGLPPAEPARDPDPSSASSPSSPSDGSADGDHDGHTQLAESLPDGYRPPPVPPAPQDGEVYAALCPYGHPNEPHSGNCRACGSPIAAAEPVLTARPLLGRIRMSSGPSVDVDRRIVIGRSPSVYRVAATDVPRLVTVSSPHQDISRSHVEVRSEDWNLVVTDLHSTNGTLVRAPDRPDQLLHPGQSMVVDPGWTVDLGDGVSFVIEAAS